MESLKSQQIEQSGIRKIMQMSMSYPTCIHLEVGQPNFETPNKIRQAGIAAIEERIIPYTQTCGTNSIKELIAQKLSKKNKVHIHQDDILVTPGAGAGLSIALFSLVAEGDEVLISDPGWPNIKSMVHLCGAIPKTYRFEAKNQFDLDKESLIAQITDRTKVIMINSPLNPTGTMIKPKELQEIYQLACKNNIYIISDEVYEDIIFDEKDRYSMKAIDTEDRVISVYGFSKSYAMTGWRVGYIAAPPLLKKAMEKIMEPLFSCNNYISLKAAEEALKPKNDDVIEKMVKCYHQRRDLAVKILKEYGMLEYIPSGTFYLLINVSALKRVTTDPAGYLLEHANVAVAPGESFGSTTNDYIRISLTEHESVLEVALRQICTIIRSI